MLNLTENEGKDLEEPHPTSPLPLPFRKYSLTHSHTLSLCKMALKLFEGKFYYISNVRQQLKSSASWEWWLGMHKVLKWEADIVTGAQFEIVDIRRGRWTAGWETFG